MAIATLGLLALALLFTPTLQQAQDPLVNFCRRFGHQTCVIDNRLYIDGGLINFNPLEQNPLNYSNTGLLYADFNVDNQGMPNEYKNLTKPASAPDVSGGILWPDTVNKYFYLYGGEFQTSPQSFAMWQYDVLHDNWTSLAPDATQSGIQRAAWGAGLAVQDRGWGYYYGGWLSNATIPTWGSTPFALSNLLMYDMVKNTWTNSTGPDTVGRAEGVMLYIPASDGGMLVYFGGIQTPGNNGTFQGQPMDTIFLYDIANAKWYTQKASGDIPGMRRRFCAGVTWSNDQSSYNIYLYGGGSMPPLTVGYDDVYILSMPTFTWIKWYPDAPGQAYPHHSLTCNVVNNNQMLVMGGTFPNSTTCDVPAVYGFHNLDLAKNNPQQAKWVGFNYSKQGYNVPSEILSVVGGGGTGGATNKAPKTGFDEPDLSVYFTREYTVATTRTATRTIPTSTGKSNSSKSHNGAIIGGAVGGGVAALILTTALVCFCLRRKRVDKATQPHELGQNGQMAPTMHSGQPSWHDGQAPVKYHQLDSEPYQPPVELAAGRASVKPSFISSSPHEKYSEVSTPPPAASPQNPYFSAITPSSASQTPAPMYGIQPHPQQYQQHLYPQSISPQEQHQQQQTYYPPPGEPQVYQGYTPPARQVYQPPSGSGQSAQSPGVSPGLSPGHSPGHVFAPSPEYSGYHGNRQN